MSSQRTRERDNQPRLSQAVLLDDAEQKATRATDSLDLLTAQDASQRVLAVLDGHIDDFDETIRANITVFTRKRYNVWRPLVAYDAGFLSVAFQCPMNAHQPRAIVVRDGEKCQKSARANRLCGWPVALRETSSYL